MSDAAAPASRAVAIIPESQRRTNERYRFSAAIRTGEVVHCSGQIGNAADGSLTSDPAAQFEQAFANVAEVLAEAGGSWADVVEMTTFHVGLAEHLAAFAGVRNRWVQEPYPAWTAVGVAELAAPTALVEVKVVAVL
jgi:enamine deaminase RidA (YjgF/YER057c/UK114 family)